MPSILFLVLTLWCWWSTPLLALTVEELAPEREWQVEAIVISGNEAFSARELLATLRTKERPWYTPWKGRPVFDPVTFTADIERLQRFYEARGYYQSRVTYDLQVDNQDALVTAHISVAEHRPVTVTDVKVEVTDHQPDPADFPFPEQLPLPDVSSLRYGRDRAGPSGHTTPSRMACLDELSCSSSW